MRVASTIAMLLFGVSLFTAAPRPTVDVAAARRTGRDEASRALARHVAGIQIAIGYDEKPAAVDTYGDADAVNHRPVTAATIFHIASISKNILAGLIVRLAEQHRLGLDDAVIKYVPNAPTRGAAITVRQLLNHTSGIYSFTSRDDAEANEQKVLSHDQVIALFKDHSPDFEPGASWRYNNSGFYLAGMVVEAVTGRPYAQYIQDELFRPLGMNSSSLCGADDVPGSAGGHRVAGGTLTATSITWSLPYAAGAVCATAADLVRWQSALESGRVVSRGGLTTMRTPTTLIDGSRIDYGLGTRIGAIGKHAVFGHTGSGGGFATMLMTVPDSRLTVAVLTNTDGTPPYEIAESMVRAALHEPRSSPRDLDAPEAELAAIAGHYDSDEGPLDLLPCGRRLCARLAGGNQDLPAQRQRANEYAVRPGLDARFDTAHGEPWLFLYGGGLFMDAKRRVPSARP
jgi:CubicO group peptidase (beta-lactamase class C family)